jgi:hypothetical protein
MWRLEHAEPESPGEAPDTPEAFIGRTTARSPKHGVDRRGRIATLLGEPVTGVVDRLAHTQLMIGRTLARLKRAAEAH